MKKIIALVLLLLIFNCKSTSKVISNTITDTISASEVKAIVSFLASDDLKGRDTGSPGINKAANFIEDKFKDFGIQPYFKAYRDEFQVGTLNAYNVVGYLEGNDPKLKDQFVIVGAHYDHIGVRKTTESDSIANGANDNAAGTAGVLTIGKYFASQKNNKRSMLFVLFSAEEKGLELKMNIAEDFPKTIIGDPGRLNQILMNLVSNAIKFSFENSIIDIFYSENIIFNIDGGNHAQFGWYGPQKGDGTAEMTTLEQQNIVISQILLFLD